MSAKKAQAQIQKFGSFLSAMVMPNIGVFIGWGLLTALFIDTGWCPNAYLNELVSPILTYLLPILIGYTSGPTSTDGAAASSAPLPRWVQSSAQMSPCW